MNRTATPADPAGAAAERQAQAERLLQVSRSLVAEVHPDRRRIDVGLDSRIDRDLGIDSLGRVELLLRVERAFRVRLPDSVLGEAETLADILAAVRRSSMPEAGGPAGTEPAWLPLPPVAETPESARTLLEVLQWHVERHPDRPHLTVLRDDRHVLGTLTFAELDAAARRLASGLVQAGVNVGERVAMMLPTGLDFFVAFFGTLHAGAVPVPIYPPFRAAQLEEHLRRHVGILRNAEAVLLIAPPETRAVAGLLGAQVETLRRVDSVRSLQSGPAAGLPAPADGAALALLQYTSGSTGDPKGVTLSHANLLANIRAMGQAMEAGSRDVFVSWLPLYHDMGLIGAWLGSLYHAAAFYVMSPVSFLARPESWLWAMHRCRATLSVAPNFAFNLCLKIEGDASFEGLDLSSVRMLASGAEAVSPDTVRRFTARFARYGFRAEAFAPVYGLAENAVGLAFSPPGRLPRIDAVCRSDLLERGVARAAAAADAKALEFVGCGRVLPGHEIRIVDDTGHEVGERREGRLEFRGPSATAAYFRNPDRTRALFHGDWLDSGDLAYMADGELYVTGRLKDVIIRAGRNLHPEEIEEAIGNLAGIRKGCVAAFGVVDQAAGSERLVVVAETRSTVPQQMAVLRQAVADTVVDFLGLPPDDVVLVPPGSVPKTSSGKLRRSAARELYLGGQLGQPKRGIRLQVLRLAAGAMRATGRRWLRRAGAFAYAGYWWTVIGLALVLVWLSAVPLPGLTARWHVTRVLARGALAAVGMRPAVRGIGHLPAAGGILVVNHASYLDVLVLAAVLPGAPLFAAKQELASQFFPGVLLRRLGVHFVDRSAPEGGVATTQAAMALARGRRLMVFFPEGTIRREAGLMPFHLGAFVIAAEAGQPLVPAGIRGTREILRADTWFPLKGAVQVEIAAPVMPGEPGFSGALRLRAAARRTVLRLCREPDRGLDQV